jgi:hypothetical protein
MSRPDTDFPDFPSQGGVAGCIMGLLFRDAESFKGLPDPWMIIDRENESTFQSLKDTIYPVRNNAPLEFLTGFTARSTL